MEDELDQELIDLLDLEEDEPKKPKSVQVAVKSETAKPIITQEPIIQEPIIEQVKAISGPIEAESLEIEPKIEPIVIQEPVVIPATTIVEEPMLLDKTEPPEEKIFASKEFLEKFINVANEIVSNHTKDRTQIENAIEYFSKEVKEARGLGLKLPPALIDGWVKLLATKSDINTNATGVLDSMAKLLAAVKNNNLIININDNKSDLDLEALLKQPAKEDEK